MNQTAFDCTTQSTQAITRSERSKWTIMAQNYTTLAQRYLSQSEVTKNALLSVQSEAASLAIKMANQSCAVEVTTTTTTPETFTTTPEIFTTTPEIFTTTPETTTTTPETTTTYLNLATTTNSPGFPAGFSLTGPADFGYVMNIILEVLEELFNESFGGLSYEQIFTSIFTGMELNGTCGN